MDLKRARARAEDTARIRAAARLAQGHTAETLSGALTARMRIDKRSEAAMNAVTMLVMLAYSEAPLDVLTRESDPIGRAAAELLAAAENLTAALALASQPPTA
jgi:hypothetical protein